MKKPEPVRTRGRILFVCTGNYYRSRFAEILFNHLADEQDLAWTANSRGILAASSGNAGPISPATLDGLAARGIAVGTPRYPMQLTAHDLAAADRVIALYDREHRALFQQHFPHIEQPIEYWDVPDLDEMSAEQALARIDRRVRALAQELARQPVFS